MVRIRLRRVGKKKQPIYKIVVADSRAARKGKFIEAIGQYNPLVNPMIIEVDETRLFWWLKRGAQPSDTLRSLLQRKGLWLKWSLVKKNASEETITAELEKWQMLQAEKLQRELEKKERRKIARKKKGATEPTPTPVAVATESAAEPVQAPAA